MTTKRLISVLLAFAAMAAFLPPLAGAPRHYRQQLRGSYANAVFDSQAGCFSTYVYLDAGEGMVKNQPGGFTPVAGFFVIVDWLNSCTGERRFALAFGELNPSDFKVDRSLNSASLNTKVTAWEYVSDLRWIWGFR